jgi:hypothetical protein
VARPYRWSRIARLKVGFGVMYSTIFGLIDVDPQIFVLLKSILVVVVALVQVVLLAQTLSVVLLVVEPTQYGFALFAGPAFLQASLFLLLSRQVLADILDSHVVLAEAL